MAGNRQQRRVQAKLERKGQVNRTFSYVNGKPGSDGEVNLSFTLRTDIPDQLENYIPVLEAALADVREEIASK